MRTCRACKPPNASQQEPVTQALIINRLRRTEEQNTQETSSEELSAVRSSARRLARNRTPVVRIRLIHAINFAHFGVRQFEGLQRRDEKGGKTGG